MMKSNKPPGGRNNLLAMLAAIGCSLMTLTAAITPITPITVLASAAGQARA